MRAPLTIQAEIIKHRHAPRASLSTAVDVAFAIIDETLEKANMLFLFLPVSRRLHPIAFRHRATSPRRTTVDGETMTTV